MIGLRELRGGLSLNRRDDDRGDFDRRMRKLRVIRGCVGCGVNDGNVARDGGNEKSDGSPSGKQIEAGDELNEERENELPFEAANGGQDDCGEKVEGVVEDVIEADGGE